MPGRFAERFAQTFPEPPLTLQVLFADRLQIDRRTFAEILQAFAPELDQAELEWYALADHPELGDLVSGDGPPASDLGLVEFGGHFIKIVQCAGPMPYGPIRSCVEPAFLSDEDKAIAAEHQAHLLLYEYGSGDPLERYVALGSIAALFASLGGSTILNEEARAAIPGADLIPDEDEDIFATLRGLPIPYLYGGLIRLDVNDANSLWMRSFANHRLNLPNLAMRIYSDEDVRNGFQLVSGILGYLRTMEEELLPGDVADLGHSKIRFREPIEQEWYLESEGRMLVIEPTE